LVAGGQVGVLVIRGDLIGGQVSDALDWQAGQQHQGAGDPDVDRQGLVGQASLE
jgi:hypothetical protein